MKTFIGLDIGGTKIAGACYDESGRLLAEKRAPVPADYASFLEACQKIVAFLRQQTRSDSPVGLSIIGAIKNGTEIIKCANAPYLSGCLLPKDMGALLSCDVRMANDAMCMTLSEAVDGAAQGAHSVLGLIMGTGIGSCFVLDQSVNQGKNGVAGEIGHLPMPYYEPEDGPIVRCGCGQMGCVETFIAGPALERLYKSMTGLEAGGAEINLLSQKGDEGALRTLDHYYNLVAKALVTACYAFDPDVFVVGGGLTALNGLYTEVPKRIGRYAAINRQAKIVIKPAQHGATSGTRGAAWLWRK